MSSEFLSPDVEPIDIEIKEEEKREKPIDALVVFGGGIISDLSLEAMAMGQKLRGQPEKGWRLPIGARLRVLGAVELFAGGEANDVILTGGSVAKGAGIEASEAKLMKKYFLHEIKKKWQKELRNHGKTEEEIQTELAERMQDAESHILLEDKATNTIENFAYTINYLEDNKDKYRNVGLLSNDFHINRIVQLANKMDVEGKGFGADTVLQEAEIDPRLKTIDRKYFGQENNTYREQVLAGLDEENRRITESRLGGSLKDAEKGERRWSRGLSRIPEYWLPNVKFIKDFGKLKRILTAEENVQKVLKEKGIEDINMAAEEELRAALDTMERKMPPEEWGEEEK